MTAGDHLARVEVTSEQQLRDWLTEHHAQAQGVWLVTFKKADPSRYVPHDAVLDQLVAFGWCDGIARRSDERTTRQLISPRRTAPWAKSYKDRAERLIASGRMHAAGLASVELAKATGAWNAMTEVDALVVPDDLARELERAAATERFAAFAPSTRRSILRWIASARQPATRERRIARTAAEAAEGRPIASHG